MKSLFFCADQIRATAKEIATQQIVWDIKLFPMLFRNHIQANTYGITNQATGKMEMLELR